MDEASSSGPLTRSLANADILLQSQRRIRRAIAALATVIGIASEGQAGEAPPAADQVKFFETEASPAPGRKLPEVPRAGEAKGGASPRLTGRPSSPGASGPAVVPGKPDESLLTEAINYEKDPRCPPTASSAPLSARR